MPTQVTFGSLAVVAAFTVSGGIAQAAEAPQSELPTAGEAAIRLVPHRAVYDLSLARSGGTRGFESASGRVVVDFSGDACKGYTMQTRQVTVLTSSENGERTSDLRSTTFEGGNGRSFRFKTATLLNGDPSQAVDGTAEAGADQLKVQLKEPKRDVFEIAGEVLLPSHHMRRLIQAARAGETTLSMKVFDGSDDGKKVYDTLALIGRPSGTPSASEKPDRDKPLREGDLAAVRRWPVVLSYFTQGQGERTPIYKLGFDLYENGISGALHLDYGEFAIDGDLSQLDVKVASKAEEECEKERSRSSK